MYKQLSTESATSSVRVTTACDLSLLRCRYYNPNVGRFSSFDVFEGVKQEPLSLHKYVYCHNNPVMNTDPSGMFIGGLVETLAVVGIKAVNYAIKLWPVVQTYLFIKDGYNVGSTLYKGFTQGWESISDSEWSDFKWSMAGLAAAAVGGKAGVHAAKSILSIFLRIPIGPAIKTFEGAAGVVGQFVRVVPNAGKAIEVGNKVRVGGFTLNNLDEPVILIREGGQSAKTVIHEYLHFIHWSLRGKPTGQAFLEFSQYGRAFERMYPMFDEIAAFILKLAQ